jgi:hypothetical protein
MLDHTIQIVQGEAGHEAICACGWRSFALSTRQDAAVLASAHVSKEKLGQTVQAAEIGWLRKIEALAPGDACEFHYPARSEWLPGTVVNNGGSGYWSICDDSDVEGCRGKVSEGIYIEQVRLPGQTEAWPR